MNSSSDPRRPEREVRYKPAVVNSQAQPVNDILGYINIFGVILSICALTMRLKWCTWVAIYCACISFANSRASDDSKQIFSTFMLSAFALVISYFHDPQPMIPPWASTM